MRKTAIILGAAALIAGGWLHPAEAARPHTIVIGDSIACRAKDELAAMRPNWIIDCAPGREVGTLATRIRADVRRYGTPRNIVLALGTNETDGWSRAAYREATNLVPDSTHVLFVTTYRSPDVFPERAPVQATYSLWMRRISRYQPNVTFVDWRSAAIAGTIALPDGVHPDDAASLLWATMVRDGVRAAGA